MTCSIAGCERSQFQKQMCQVHYSREFRGKPLLDQKSDGVDWCEIPGFPSYLAHVSGRLWSKKLRRWLKTHVCVRTGYERASVVTEGKPRTFKMALVHRLICAAFHGNPTPEKPQVRHLNSIRTDNRPLNLAWGDRFDNARDAVNHGTYFNRRNGGIKKNVQGTRTA